MQRLATTRNVIPSDFSVHKDILHSDYDVWNEFFDCINSIVDKKHAVSLYEAKKNKKNQSKQDTGSMKGSVKFSRGQSVALDSAKDDLSQPDT